MEIIRLRYYTPKPGAPGWAHSSLEYKELNLPQTDPLNATYPDISVFSTLYFQILNIMIQVPMNCLISSQILLFFRLAPNFTLSFGTSHSHSAHKPTSLGETSFSSDSTELLAIPGVTSRDAAGTRLERALGEPSPGGRHRASARLDGSGSGVVKGRLRGG